MTQARSLARHQSLGIHLRADLLSIAANCDNSVTVESDLATLDTLTQQHAEPLRNFELLIFAARVALTDDRYKPLLTMSRQPGYMRRWLRLGPDLATAALTLHHAAAIGATGTHDTKGIDKEGTAGFYRLLCTTFPAKARGSMCHQIALMRGDGAMAEKRAVAKQALAAFVQTRCGLLARPNALMTRTARPARDGS